jgi:hypothetical protein
LIGLTDICIQNSDQWNGLIDQTPQNEKMLRVAEKSVAFTISQSDIDHESGKTTAN